MPAIIHQLLAPIIGLLLVFRTNFSTPGPADPGGAFHSRRLVTLYVLSLPLGIADAIHYWTVPIVMGVFYIMAGIEFIGEEIEDPFGSDENDLPVGQLVEGSARQVDLVLVPAAPAS